MAKRHSKAQRDAFISLLGIGLAVVAIEKFFGVMGFVIPLFICIAGFGSFVWYKAIRKRNKVEWLQDKYKDEVLVQRVLQADPWEGQTREQLIDSLGNPSGIDIKVLKTRKREIWKYHQQGANRYGLRVTLDDDVVVGWDKKA